MNDKQALEKLDHTLCLNSPLLKFGIDDEDHIDCIDTYEMISCIETIAEALDKKEKQDKILEILKRPLFYSERKKLGEEYIKWAKENNAAQNDLTTIITWCFCFKMKEMLENVEKERI